MALGKRLINTGGEAACTTETTDIFGDGNGKALYSLDFDASDTSGSYNATPTNVDFGVSGKTLNGARFNGSNSKITRENIFDNTQVKMSASVWVRATDYSPSSNIAILDIGDNDTVLAQNRIFISGTSPHNIFVSVNGGDGGFAQASQSFTDNSWNHIVATWDVTGGGVTNGIKIYLNGSLAAQGNSTQGFNSARDLALGVNEDQSVGDRHFFSGTLDQVRIFSTELSLSQVQTLYNSGNGESACVHTSTTDTVNFPSGTTNAAYLKMDNSAKDEVSGNTGSDTNVQYRFGKYNQSAFFNDTGIINTGFTRSGTSFSVSMWLNLNDNGTRQIFLGDGNTAGADTSITLSAQVDASDDVVIFVNNGQSSGNVNTVVSYAGKYNKWTHFVVTLNGTSGAVYLDNAKTTFTADRSLGTAAQAFGIGSWSATASNGGETDGFIDQVRFYNAQLSDANVTSLFEEKPETDTSNFKTVLYEGTSANQYISNVGMDLETSGGLVWIKNRDVTDHHVLFDSVRGATKYIMSSFANGQESTDSATLTSFEKNGFFLGADGTTGGAANGNNESLVAWCWKGNGAAVTNTNGANINSSVSANTAAGFSIVTYTGTGNGNVTSDTVGHGLSSTPNIVMIKNRSANDNWQIQANIGGTYKSGGFNTSTFSVASPTPVADPTSTVFNPFFSNASNNYVAYLWHSVSGYSRVSTYTGAGSGTRVYTTDDGTSSGSNGFKPSFVVIKNADTGGAGFGWYVYDTRRDDLDGDDNLEAYILWESNDAEVVSNTGSNGVVMENDGFTLDVSATALNGVGDTFLFMAFK